MFITITSGHQFLCFLVHSISHLIFECKIAERAPSHGSKWDILKTPIADKDLFKMFD